MKDYLFNILIGLDQLANTLLAGNPDETISLRAKKAYQNGELWGCVLCKVLGWFDKDHCDKVST